MEKTGNLTRLRLRLKPHDKKIMLSSDKAAFAFLVDLRLLIALPLILITTL